MNHDKLLKEARELAAAIEHGQLAHLGRDDCVKIIVTLALIVEQQDKALAEAVAACKVCAEVIPKPLKAYQLSGFYGELKAAGHLASRAAKLGEPKGDNDEAAIVAEMAEHAVAQIESGDNDFVDLDEFRIAELKRVLADVERRILKLERVPSGTSRQVTMELGKLRTRHKRLETELEVAQTMSVATKVYDALLKRLADDDTTNQAPPKGDDEELAKAKQWLRVAPKLQRALGLAPPTIEEAEAEMAEAEAVPMADEEISRIANAATVAPVEVEMQAFPDTDEWHTWRCNLAGKWVYANHLTDAPFCSTRLLAVESGNAWLADVSKRIGVPLEAVWKDGE